MKLPKCPCCEERFKYFEVFWIKKKDRHKCSKCNEALLVVIKKQGKTLAGFLAGAGFSAFVFCFLTANSNALLPAVLTAMPFFVFYTLIPFFIEFKKCKMF
ncbi:MAG: hypothetical protein LBT82_00255 [Oscillospiraceae bacterium]|jgi:CXXC-20-CXXC protein|nr:hypothetical protein [Oscillospiraceae bacterium]